MTEALKLEDFGDDLRRTSERPVVRPRTLPMTWEPPSGEHVQAWFAGLSDEDGARLLAVEGPSSAHRSAIYTWCAAASSTADSWLVKGVNAHFSDQLSMLHGPDRDWGLIQSILNVGDFIVEGPLHDLIDQGFRFTELFQALWEARFLHSEGRDAQPLVQAIIAWLTCRQLDTAQQDVLSKAHITHELASPQEQLDVFFFLLSLACQNGVLDRAAVAFDGLERALGQTPAPRRKLLRDLLSLTATADRWARLGSPLGVIIGFSDGHGALDSLKRSNAKLNVKVRSALV